MRAATVAIVLLSAVTARAQSDGQLVIASTPPGANISVDGKAMGKAPVIAKGLLPGDHVVQADWGDGRTLTQVQKVAGGSQVVQLTAPAPAVPQVGNVVIVTEPGGADVLIDGKPLGKSPLLAQNLPAGDHNVVVRFADGKSASGVAHVAAGASAVLQLKASSAPAAVAPGPAVPPATAPPSPTPPPAGATPTTPPPSTSTTTPPPPGAETTAPPGTPPPAGTTEATAPPPATNPSPAATPAPQPELTQTAPPPERKKKKWVPGVIAGVVVGVVVIGVAVGLGVGLSGGNSRYGIAEF